MAKKIVKNRAKKVVQELPVDIQGFQNPKITEINIDFGREDLNALKDKVNEIIKAL